MSTIFSLHVFFANLQDEVGKSWETQKSPRGSPMFIWKVEKNLDIDPRYGSEDAIGCQKFAISIVLDGKNRKTSDSEHCFYHWIGFVGKIYRKPWFLPSNIGLKPVNFPIIQFYDRYHLVTWRSGKSPWNSILVLGFQAIC